VQNLYDPLLILNPDLSTSPGLAMEINANADATEYEIKLRPGVEFHNGKSFTADDLIYSIRLMSKPANFASAPFVAGINLDELKAVNPTTVRVPLKFPDADLGANSPSAGTRGSCRRRDGLPENRSAQARSCSSRSSPAPRAFKASRTTGHRQAVRRLAPDPRSTTTRHG
jgi:hypothetical protein